MVAGLLDNDIPAFEHLLYCIPAEPIMKVIFENKQNLFSCAQQLTDRKQQNVRNTRTNSRHSLEQGEKGRAEGLKPQSAAACQGESDVHSHHAFAGGDRPQKQGQGGQEPEQQVQSGAQQGQAQTAAQHPEQVVDHAQPQAQQQCAGEGENLFRNGDIHLSAAAGRRSRPSGPALHRSASRWCPPHAGRRRPD